MTACPASEGGIYGNFRFHPATYRFRYEIQPHQAVFKEGRPRTGSLELVGAEQIRELWPVLHAQVRARRVGELSPQAGRWDQLNDLAHETNGPLQPHKQHSCPTLKPNSAETAWHP